MNFRALAASAAISIGICGLVDASEIYKWTDENGNVQYTDKPVGESSERVQIQSRPTNPQQVARESEAVRTQQKTSEERREERDKAAAERLEIASEQQDRAQKCEMYRQRLTRFVQSRRLYKEDENGERVYLDDEETQAAREKTQRQVEEFCSG